MTFKFVITLALVCCFFLNFAGVAIAAQCRTVDHQEICLVSIKRSAKYHWQYRAELKIDGQRQPSEKFDCREPVGNRPGDRQERQKQKRDFVCNLIPKR
ncbi:hypothetical protein [[Limnothrix rosea] IAM M-220]|uniref:hypothetical protein n=1 Tax=[Limnothrix rosea] IAM M-220 TaxID=454133 RepID=UPI00095D7053|nr:hypothetical protein [[Limnothrix rosea] IAM M-220]OKH11019.1 hypothetical protein NIES208_17885 [[Limnothrix rosea] IAM M-220]